MMVRQPGQRVPHPLLEFFSNKDGLTVILVGQEDQQVQGLNAPQVAGGKSPFGIDPSGFIQMVMKIAGYPISRLAQQQINEGNKLAAINEGKAGDVAFLNTSKSELHAGIMLDDQRIIHVDGKVHIDHLNNEGIVNSDTKVCTHQLIGVRRYINIV